MTSKLVVNTIEADTGISSVSFASSISMSSTSKFHFGNAGIDIGADTNINRPSAGVLGFNINSSEKVRITSNGNILVGKTADAGKGLEIYDSNNAALRVQNSHTGQGATDGLLIETSFSDSLIWNYENSNTRFGTNNSERLRITSTGKVNIGGDFTASTYGLQVWGSGGTNSASLGIKNNTSGPAGIHLLSGHGNWSIFNSWAVGDALEFRDESAGAIRAMIDSAGRFIVGHNSNIDVGGHNSAFLLTGNTYHQHTAAIIANENTARGAMLQFAKQRSGSAGGNTIVQNGDKIGHMRFVACDGNDLNSRVAEISAEMDGAPGSNSTPGRLIFRTTPSGSDDALERLRINKDGHVTKPNQPSFRAGLSGNTTVNTNSYIVFNDTGATWHHNIGNHYDTSNGRFTAPVDGVYTFNACVIFGPFGGTNNVFMGDAFLFYVNGGNAGYSGRRGYYISGDSGNNYYTDHMSITLKLNYTDYVQIRNGAPYTAIHGNTYYTWFAGTLLG